MELIMHPMYFFNYNMYFRAQTIRTLVMGMTN